MGTYTDNMCSTLKYLYYVWKDLVLSRDWVEFKMWTKENTKKRKQEWKKRRNNKYGEKSDIQ